MCVVWVVFSIIPTDEEVASLPHVCRDQLDLTQFLGSGAFGEVYEGVARDIRPDAPGPIRCAIKVTAVLQSYLFLSGIQALKVQVLEMQWHTLETS